MKKSSLIAIVCSVLGYAFLMYEFFINEAFIMKTIFFIGMAIMAGAVGILTILEGERESVPSVVKKLVTLVFGGCAHGFSKRSIVVASICILLIIGLFWVEGTYATLLQVVLFDFLMYMAGIVVGIIFMFIGGMPG